MNYTVTVLPRTPEDRTEWPFMVNGSNYIGDAAKTLADWVETSGYPAFFAWNGTPFDGYPGDDADAILERHWKTRNLWQVAIKHGWEAPRFEEAAS